MVIGENEMGRNEEMFEIFSVTDDAGEEHKFIFIAEIEDGEKRYWICEEVEETPDSLVETGELYLFKKTEKDGEVYLSSVDDEEEFQRVSQAWEEYVTLEEMKEGDEELDE